MKKLIRFLEDQMMIKTQSIDSMEIYANAMSKDLVSEKEEIKYSNIKKQYKNQF